MPSLPAASPSLGSANVTNCYQRVFEIALKIVVKFLVEKHQSIEDEFAELKFFKLLGIC